MKNVPDILRTGVRFDGLDTFGDANRQNAALMERLTQHCVIEAQITRHRVDMAPWSCLDALDGPLDLVEQGQHIPGIARIALGHKVGKEETRGRFRDDTGLSAKLRRAIALAFDNGSNRGIVGIDKFTKASVKPRPSGRGYKEVAPSPGQFQIDAARQFPLRQRLTCMTHCVIAISPSMCHTPRTLSGFEAATSVSPDAGLGRGTAKVKPVELRL